MCSVIGQPDFLLLLQEVKPQTAIETIDTTKIIFFIEKVFLFGILQHSYKDMISSNFLHGLKGIMIIFNIW